MSEHSPHISERMLRNLPSRVSQIAQGLLLVVGIASMGISIAGEWSHGHHFLNDWLLNNVDVMGALLHVTLIVLVLFPGRIRPLNDDVADPDVRRIIQCLNTYCLRAWDCLWFAFGLLYVTLLFTTIAATHAHDPVALGAYGAMQAALPGALMDVFGVGTTFFILLVYVSLTPGFLRACASRRNSMHWRSSPHARWLILMSALALIAATLRLGGIYFFPDPVSADKYLSLALGVAAAVTLAYFAGRMDSKFILNWQWLIPVLFLYAGIQVYNSVLYETTTPRRALLVYGAFTMKCLMFIFMSNFFESRGIVYYAAELVNGDDRIL